MAMRLNENLDDNGEMHEINVTPFIDVMLVLLIIFMVAAPLATVDVKVNLPASSSQPQPRPEKPIYLSVKADKSMFPGQRSGNGCLGYSGAGPAHRRQERHHRLLPRG